MTEHAIIRLLTRGKTMAATPSTMLPLGTIAPDFSLPDTVSGKQLALAEIKSDRATVIMFICNHCPYVLHIMSKLIEVERQYHKQGVNFIAISSNDIEKYPQDAPELMTQFAKKYNFSFPYLYDESQTVAHAYQAACTPDFYLFDGEMTLQYRGRFDASSVGNNNPVNGDELIAALDCLLNNKPINENQKPSIGCNIKWKKN